MFETTLRNLTDITRALDAPHDQDFKGRLCEDIHEALRRLSPADWGTLRQTWSTKPLTWICNLTYCLDPDYHAQEADALLVDILRRAHPDARAYAADTLLFDSLYVPDAAMSAHLQACLIQAQAHSKPHTVTYRTQLYTGLLAKQPVARLAEAHEHSVYNRAALAQSDQAACYYCRTTFAASEVAEFTDDAQTALCPYCGIDAVLPETAGYPLDYMTLRALHQYWF
ncbi:MAG: hypothetical protein AAGN35_18505 [Bacteroidota bacterium]